MKNNYEISGNKYECNIYLTNQLTKWVGIIFIYFEFDTFYKQISRSEK